MRTIGPFTLITLGVLLFAACVAEITPSKDLAVISQVTLSVDLGSGVVSRRPGERLDFGEVAKNNQKSGNLILKNSGPGKMVMESFALDPGIPLKPSIFRLDSMATAQLIASPLAPGAQVTIPISFNPRDNGDRAHVDYVYSAILTIKTNDRDNPVYTINFKGTQTPPILDVSIAGTSTPSGEILNFGPVQTSTTKDIEIHMVNPGSSDLPVAFTTSLPWSIVAGSPTAIVAGGSGDVTIRFTPGAETDFSQTLEIALGTAGAQGTYTLNLEGRGVGTANNNLRYSDDGGNSYIVTTPYNYGGVDVGQNSTITFWLKNTGVDAQTIDTVSMSGDYAITEVYNGASPLNAPFIGTIAVGGTYRIKVKFTPTVMGTRTGFLVVSSKGGLHTNSLELSGLATAPILEVSQGFVTYPHQGRAYDFGLSNNTKLFTFRNTGTSNLKVSVILSSKPSIFSATNTTYNIAPGGSSNFNISYANGDQSSRENEILYVLSNSYQQSSYELRLSGGGSTLNLGVTGNPYYQDYLLNSKALDLGDRSILGSTSQNFTITNNEPFAVDLSNTITPTAGTPGTLAFTIPSPFILQPGASQDLNMVYTAPGTPELSEKKVVLTDAQNRSFIFYGSAINATPPSQSGLVAWFRSDKISTTDVNMSSGDPLSTGVKLTGWNATVSAPAQAPSQLTLQNPTVNAQPLYFANQSVGTFNGRPFIRFDGTTTYLTTNRTPVSQLILNSATGSTYFMVFKPQNTFWAGRDVINGHNTGSYTRVFPMVSTEAFVKIGGATGFTRFRQSAVGDVVISNQTEIAVDTPYILGGISSQARTSTPSYLDDLPFWVNGVKQTVKTARVGFTTLATTPVLWNSNTYWYTSATTANTGQYSAYYLPNPLTAVGGTVTTTVGSPPASATLPFAARLNPPVSYPFSPGLILGNAAPGTAFRGVSVPGGLIPPYYTADGNAVTNFTDLGVDTVVDNALDPYNPPTVLWPHSPDVYPSGSPYGASTFNGLQVPATTTLDNLGIGARLTGATTASTFSSIDVLEILLYNKGLSDLEVDTVNSYLKQKYNIP